MTCVGCAQELPEGAVFCPACGTRQAPATCGSCGSELTTGAAFCFRCGASVGAQPAATMAPRTAERRLTSVLFADLVGYTTLSETRDTEDVRELLTSYFDVCSTVVRRYGGTVEKFIGDAVMAVWGVPTAHEDDAERAVRAATELVASVAELGTTLGVPELQLRAGVVTGEVAATLGATDQGMVAGDPVNTAARVQAAAGPGEVWVDGPTRSLTAAGVTYIDVGTHALKGKAEPLQLYKVGTIVAAVGGNQRVDGLEAPLSGRDRELRLVKELFHGTVESGRPRMVVLDGEAGVGKSRLAWEFEKYVSGIETDVYWHRGRCVSYGDGVAYWALSEALRARLGLVDDTGAVGDVDLDLTLAQWIPDTAERDWLRPRLATLVGGELGEFEREDLFAAWTRFFERLGDDSEAITLVIDDAQHADDGLLDFLSHLLGNARTPVFVLLLTRPELLEEHPQLGGRRSARVPLEPLNDTAMNALVAGLVEDLPEQARRALVSRAEGIPLFAVETVRALIDRDVVRPEGGRYVVASGASLDLTDLAAPASLHALVSARLDALSPEERRVVADASVLGATFTRQGIDVLCGDIPDLESVLVNLQRKEIISTDNDRFSAERGQFRFIQTVVRQVAYATLSKRDRKQRHLDVAGHLQGLVDHQPEIALLVARHLVDAVEASGPDDADVPDLNARASGLLVQAAARSSRLGANADALRLFRDAAARTPGGILHADALMGAADAASALGRYDEECELYLEAEKVYNGHGEPALAIGAAVQLARVHMLQGELQIAEQEARDAWERARDLEGEAALQAQAAVLLSRLSGRRHQGGAEAFELMGEALRRCEVSDDLFTLVRTLNFFATQQSAYGSAHVSRAIMRELVTICRANEQWYTLIGTLLNLSLMERLGSMTAALGTIEDARQVAVEHGYTRMLVWPNEATTLWCAGRWSDHAAVVTEVAEDLADLTIGDHVIVYATDLWRRDAGLPTTLSAAEGASDDPNWRMWDALVRATDAAWRGEIDQARAHGLACLEHALSDAGVTDDFVVAVPRAARLLADQGDVEVARQLVQQLEGRPKGLPAALLAAYEHAFRGLVGVHDGDDPAIVESELRAGIEGLGASGAVPDRAHAQADLGWWLLTHGRTDEGRELLQSARTTYVELGAVRWVERVDEKLGARTAEHA